MKLLVHGMKVVIRVLAKRLHRIVSDGKMESGFMPGRGSIDAVFILRRMQEEYYAVEKKFYMCFVHLEMAINRVPRNVSKLALR